MPDMGYGKGSGGKNKGLYATPGDRGDSCHKMGLAKITSGYAGNLKGEASKGYDSIQTGWGGNVKR